MANDRTALEKLKRITTQCAGFRVILVFSGAVLHPENARKTGLGVVKISLAKVINPRQFQQKGNEIACKGS